MTTSRQTGNGESSSSTRGAPVPAAAPADRNLDETMREPSTTTPDVVVLNSTHDEKKVNDAPNPREDLWLSSSDGRYGSPVIPLRVGRAPYVETFYVHKNVLITSEYFRKALCGDFKEAGAQSIDLPEEDPAIFHFVVAFLYQRTFVPIKPVASVLARPETENGKSRDSGGGQQGQHMADSDSDSSSSSSEESPASEDSLARSRRMARRRQRRQERQWERAQQKHPGTHRPSCRCPRCSVPVGPPCWNCGVSRPRPNQPGVHPHYLPAAFPPPVRRRRTARRNPHRIPTPPGSPPGARRRGRRRRDTAGAAGGNSSDDGQDTPEARIQGEDMRAWLQTYTLTLEVYICANKFLMDDFKAAIRRHCIDMLETAGADAANPTVLRLCASLWAGVPESDELLRMVFARVGFLQPLLWKRAREETNEFLVNNPEVSALILREAASRREEDIGGANLPSMETLTGAVGGHVVGGTGPPPFGHPVIYGRPPPPMVFDF